MADDHVASAAESKCILVRQGDYRERCKSANRGFNSDLKRRSEVHHLVCEHSVAQRKEKYEDDEQERYIEECLRLVEWDINNDDNLWGMPRNRQFRTDWSGPTSDWQPRQIPSHQVDHNTLDGYTNEVADYLHDTIWSKLQAKKKSHELDASKIKDGLVKASKHFLDQLQERGKRQGGTVDGWSHRFEESWKTKWYEPFSMGQTPSERSPGSPSASLSEVFKKM